MRGLLTIRRLAVALMLAAPGASPANPIVESFEHAALERCLLAVLYKQEIDVTGLTRLPGAVAKMFTGKATKDTYQVGGQGSRVFLTVHGPSRCSVEAFAIIDDSLDQFAERALTRHSFPFAKVTTKEGHSYYVEGTGAVVRFTRTGSVYRMEAFR